MKQADSANKLPYEIWLKILSYLCMKDLANCIYVSKYLYELLYKEVILFLSVKYNINRNLVTESLKILNLTTSDEVTKVDRVLKQFPALTRNFIIDIVKKVRLASISHTICSEIYRLDSANPNAVTHFKALLKAKSKIIFNYLYEIMSAGDDPVKQLMYAIYCQQPWQEMNGLLLALPQNKYTYNTYLNMAATCRHLPAVQQIYKQGIQAGIDFFDLVAACEKAMSYGYLEIVKYLVPLIKARGEIEFQRVVNATKAVARFGHAHIMRWILNQDPLNFDEAILGELLQIACKYNHLPIVKMLIKLNADVNYGSSTTPLICAAQKGHYQIAKYLLAHGAKVNAQVYQKEDYLVRNVSALYVAVISEEVRIVNLLLKYGALDLKIDSFGDNAFKVAIREEYADIVKLLIKNFPEQVMLFDSVIEYAIAANNLDIPELIFTVKGMQKFCQPVWSLYHFPLQYIYRFDHNKPNLIHACFKGIARNKINVSGAKIALSTDNINMTAHLLRFMFECIHVVNKSAHLRPTTLFTPPQHFTKFAFHAALAVKACIFEHANEAGLQPFLSLLNGEHPVLSKVYHHFIKNRPSIKDDVISIKKLMR